MHPTDQPLAAPGLQSFRYAGRYGWVMIGAKDEADALREAARSIDGPADRDKLQVWDDRTESYQSLAGTPRLGGLSREEWLNVGRVMFRWPGLGVCSAETSEDLQGMVNRTIARMDVGERDPGEARQQEGDSPAGHPDTQPGDEEKTPSHHERTTP
jgi:hypothetical protein